MRTLSTLCVAFCAETALRIRAASKIAHPKGSLGQTSITFLGLAEGFFIPFIFMYSSKKKIGSVVFLMLSYYRSHRRSFPWRDTTDPYHVLVSEYMLQQTQTDRVVPKYISFLKSFPDVGTLARASRRDVLTLWSGLGYNRRAVALHNAAKIIADAYDKCVPNTKETLLTLPGVGDYTAGAVLAFAYNKPVIIVETNIRTVVFHYCVREKGRIEDGVVHSFVEKMLCYAVGHGISPRVFYSAMMDYGSYLKSSGVRVNTLSQHYVKQKSFDGSVRQARGTLLRFLVVADKGVSEKKLECLEVQRIKEGLSGLVADGLVEKRGKYYYLV